MKASVRVHHYSDSDLPESPESSPDEDFGSKTEKFALFLMIFTVLKNKTLLVNF